MPLRWVGLILLALAVRAITQIAIANGVEAGGRAAAAAVRGCVRILLILGLWPNRDHPGLLAVMVGAAANGLAIVINGGWMPVWAPALDAVGMSTGELNVAFHRLLPTDFRCRLLPPRGPARETSSPSRFRC